MKLKEIIYSLKSIIHSGKITDDTDFDNRLIVHWVNTQRQLWLNNEYNKGRFVRNNELQVLKGVEFEIIDGNQYDAFATNSRLLKSKNKVPRVLQIHAREMVTAARPLDVLGENANFVEREQAVYAGNGIFNRGLTYMFRHEDYLFVKFPEQNTRGEIPLLWRVEGIFENPLEVDDFNGTEDNIWDGIDDYPISSKFIDYLNAEVLKADVVPLFKSPRDTQTDDEYLMNKDEQGN